MTAFNSYIVISHARKLARQYGTAKAARYLAVNGIELEVAVNLLRYARKAG